jgi:organic radical activating enzyme
MGKHASDGSAPTDSDINVFIDKLIEMKCSTGKRLIVNISGGEPTTHTSLSRIIERLHEHAIIIVSTNGTRSVDWWRGLPRLPHLVIISLHPEYYDAKKLKINNLANFLSDNGVSLHFNLLCLPQKWDTVMEIVDDIDQRFKSWIVPKIIQEQGTFNKNLYPYSKEQLDFIRNYPTRLNNSFSWNVQARYKDETFEKAAPNSIMANGLHYFQNWRCSAGSEGISVRSNGLVMAGTCGVIELGHMRDFKFLNSYLTCSRPNCICPGDIFLNKYNPISVDRVL